RAGVLNAIRSTYQALAAVGAQEANTGDLRKCAQIAGSAAVAQVLMYRAAYAAGKPINKFVVFSNSFSKTTHIEQLKKMSPESLTQLAAAFEMLRTGQESDFFRQIAGAMARATGRQAWYYGPLDLAISLNLQQQNFPVRAAIAMINDATRN